MFYKHLSRVVGWLTAGIVVALFCAPKQVLATVYFQHSSALPGNQTYDFIVVGGGAGGGAVATRIAENKGFKVLVIEAGPSDQEFFEIQVPGLLARVAPLVDWGFTTVPQVNANNQAIAYSRARVLGGCTSHNDMTYTRGSKDDYDRWAAVVNDNSFTWSKMFPYILKSERFMEDVEHQDMEGHVDFSVHGRNGKLGVTAPYSHHPINDLVLETTRVLKDEFPFRLDINDGRPIGIGWNQLTINQGLRSSSAAAFLATGGDNLHVLLNTYVTRVIPAGNPDRKDFRIVEFGPDAQSPRQQIEASREVIISGGVINTPQILLNSGIGARSDLDPIGIQTLVNNPSVGRNLSDQVSVFGLVPTTLPSTGTDLQDLEEWNKTHTGPLSRSTPLDHFGWIRLPEDSPALRGHEDPTGGKDSPHIEYVPFAIGAPPGNPSPPLPTGVNLTIQFLAVNLHPVSRGSLTINSSNPFDRPVIDFNILHNDLDVAVIREGLRSIQRFFSAPLWDGKAFDMILPSADIIPSDELLTKYIRSNASPFLHGVGSASMSPKGAKWGVVDPDFKVKGVNGLRIADASVIPFVPSGHTQAPIYAFAERAAEIIRKSWE